MGESYSRTLVETAAAMLLIPKPAGVLANNRFFYTKTLKKSWSAAETPYPKRAEYIPSILSQQEVTRLIERLTAAEIRQAGWGFDSFACMTSAMGCAEFPVETGSKFHLPIPDFSFYSINGHCNAARSVCRAADFAFARKPTSAAVSK